MFNKGDVVIYPSKGRSKVSSIYTETDGQKFYELKYENELKIFVPIAKAEQFGMRYPLSKAEILKLLKKQIKINIDDLSDVAEIIRGRFISGQLEDILYIIKLLKKVAKNKLEKNKKLELSEKQSLEQATEVLISEVDYVLGDGSAQKYVLK